MPMFMREDIAVLVVVLSVDTFFFFGCKFGGGGGEVFRDGLVNETRQHWVSGDFIMVVEDFRMVIGVVELIWGRFE